MRTRAELPTARRARRTTPGWAPRPDEAQLLAVARAADASCIDPIVEPTATGRP